MTLSVRKHQQGRMFWILVMPCKTQPTA